jgi:hypothetical protein
MSGFIEKTATFLITFQMMGGLWNWHVVHGRLNPGFFCYDVEPGGEVLVSY